MILSRPTNLWLGLITAALGLIQVSAIALVPGIDAAVLATVLGAAGLFLGSVISLVANQDPTVHVGSTVNVVTPADQPNYTTTV